MSYGEKIKMLRKLHKLTQAEFADAIGAGRSTAAMWETEIRMPRDPMKKKIAKYFHVSVQAIFFDD